MLHGDLDPGMTLHLLLENKYTRWFDLLNTHRCMVKKLLGISGELLRCDKMLDSNEIPSFLHVSSWANTLGFARQILRKFQH